MSLRWLDYVTAEASGVAAVWKQAAKGASEVVFIAGEGFDPRTLVALERLLAADVSSALRLILLELQHGGSAPGLRERARENGRLLENAAAPHASEMTRIPSPDVEDPRSLGKVIFQRIQPLISETTVTIVDISALPARIYFPIIAGLIQAHDDKACRDVLVAVCENPVIDRAILSQGQSADPGPMVGFGHGLTSLTLQALRIWAPVLGEGQVYQVEALHQYQPWDEIIPVLPFPARNPRRADDLLIEHQFLFADPLEVDARNIIYAHESNPFDLYRTLCRLGDRYQETLRPLGPTTLVLSAHASKTLSLGVLLAAYERRFPVVAAGVGGGYVLDKDIDIDSAAHANDLNTFWLCGEPYR